MTRKRCKRTIRRLVAPTCVAMILNPEVSLLERGAVLAMRGGWATTDHFNVLADCRDMLLLAARENCRHQESTRQMEPSMSLVASHWMPHPSSIVCASSLDHYMKDAS